jgi:ethanolamine utilization protein EutN
VQLGLVIGTVVATRKDANLSAVTLLLVQPLTADRQPSGRPIVAADSVGAGVGEEVFFVRGKEASFPFYPVEAPVDAGIVGIVDHWDTEIAGLQNGRIAERKA